MKLVSEFQALHAKDVFMPDLALRAQSTIDLQEISPCKDNDREPQDGNTNVLTFGKLSHCSNCSSLTVPQSS